VDGIHDCTIKKRKISSGTTNTKTNTIMARANHLPMCVGRFLEENSFLTIYKHHREFFVTPCNRVIF
jgi:hypothetical protein